MSTYTQKKKFLASSLGLRRKCLCTGVGEDRKDDFTFFFSYNELFGLTGYERKFHLQTKGDDSARGTFVKSSQPTFISCTVPSSVPSHPHSSPLIFHTKGGVGKWVSLVCIRVFHILDVQAPSRCAARQTQTEHLDPTVCSQRHPRVALWSATMHLLLKLSNEWLKIGTAWKRSA